MARMDLQLPVRCVSGVSTTCSNGGSRVLQDGKAAGQTVPHVHFHLLPRKFRGDRFASQNDEVYPALERAEGELPAQMQAAASAELSSSPGAANGRLVESGEPIRMDADEDRKPRTMEEMIKEAEWLKGFLDSSEK